MRKCAPTCISLFLFYAIFPMSCQAPEDTRPLDDPLFTLARKALNSAHFPDASHAELEEWRQLAGHKPGNAVMNKVLLISEAYGVFGDMEIQSIENARGAIINMDYFSVTIQALPVNPSTGWRFTPDEFLEYIRKNLNSFVDTEVSGFNPSQVTGFDEHEIWYSSNPLGAILHIDVSTEARNGSVICTLHGNSRWIFSTIEVPYNPFFYGYDGEHTVSGVREFGYTPNSNGTFTIYTRGIDRITDFVDAKIVSTLKDNPFDSSHFLWTSLMNGIYNFTITNQGVATAPTYTSEKNL